MKNSKNASLQAQKADRIYFRPSEIYLLLKRILKTSSSCALIDWRNEWVFDVLIIMKLSGEPDMFVCEEIRFTRPMFMFSSWAELLPASPVAASLSSSDILQISCTRWSQSKHGAMTADVRIRSPPRKNPRNLSKITNIDLHQIQKK